MKSKVVQLDHKRISQHSPINRGTVPLSTESFFGCVSAKITNARIAVPMLSARKAVVVVTGKL